MSNPPEVTIKLVPRRQFLDYIRRTQRWACLVVHRRGGKTYACIQDLIARSLTHTRTGPPLRYAYLAPTRDQAKDIAWGYLKRFTSRIPGVRVNEAELKVMLPNAAEIRLYSGDSYERLRGLYLDGVVIDEPADIDPSAWHAVIRPCLSDYEGWATFIGTPKGRNHFWRLWKEALQQTAWFTLILRSSESGIIKAEELASIKAGTPEHLFRQEMECDFSVGRIGAIYARHLEGARTQRRVSRDILWHKECPVFTSFDVGAPLNQRCWVWQMVGDRVVFLEALFGDHDCGTPADWVKRLQDRPYNYGAHFIPHDAATSNGGLWQGAMLTAGLVNIVAVPRQISVWDGINAALESFDRVSFAEETCSRGIDALDAYHAKEESDGVTIRDVPVHDHASHAADAFSLAFQAIRHGLVVDRSRLPRRPLDHTRRPALARMS